MVIARMYQVTEVLQEVHQVLPQVQVRAEEEQQGEINMKGLAKIIGIILGILGLSAKATKAKKAKVKKIDTKVKTIKKQKAQVQKKKVAVQKKKAAVKKTQKKAPKKKPSVNVLEKQELH